jgi:hypothetical protein
MEVSQKELDTVEQLLAEQNAFKAAIFRSLWCVPLLWLWYISYLHFPDVASAFIFISGLIIGAFVRFHGRGFTPLFSLIGFLLHALIIFAAILLNMLIPPGSVAWASVLLGLMLTRIFLVS